MDTDELSDEAYKGVLGEARNFHGDLTLRFGLLASHCLNQNEYLLSALDLIGKYKSYKAEDLDDIFFDNTPDIKSFKRT